jgi:hypothetical protein
MQLPIPTQQPSKPPRLGGGRTHRYGCSEPLDCADCSATGAWPGTRCAGTSRDSTKCVPRPRVKSGHVQPSALAGTRGRHVLGIREEEGPQSTDAAARCVQVVARKADRRQLSRRAPERAQRDHPQHGGPRSRPPPLRQLRLLGTEVAASKFPIAGEGKERAYGSKALVSTSDRSDVGDDLSSGMTNRAGPGGIPWTRQGKATRTPAASASSRELLESRKANQVE